MPFAPAPYSKQKRPSTLGERRLLNTPAEPGFDDLTNRAVARDGEANPRRMIGIAEDVTRQKESKDAANALNSLIRRAGRMACIGGWEHDLVNGTALWSDEIYAMHDLEIGTPMTPKKALEFYPEDARATIEDARRKTVETGEPWDLELPRITATGRQIWIRSQGECIYDDNGRPIKLWGAVQDITGRRHAQDQLRHAATHDSLTGLPNRALLLDRLQQCIHRAARSSNRRFAVLFLDFDRFKFVNDTLGHSAGDDLLHQIAARLRNSIRPADTLGVPAGNLSTVSRLGGDEFVIILDQIQDHADALLVAERLLGALAQPYILGDVETVSTASVGIVTSGPEYATADQMLRDADTAMYEAKATGRGRCVLFARSSGADALVG